MTENLSDILIQNIKKYLPNILQELSQRKNEVESEIYTLGPSLPESNEGKISHLHLIVSNFCRDFSKSINRRGDKINTGRKIKDIFINFRKGLEMINPFSEEIYTDEYIYNIMDNYDGNHMSFNVFPIEVLEYCLKDSEKNPINNLLKPSLDCLYKIHSEILYSIDDIFKKDSIHRFNSLTDKIKGEMNKILNENILPTNKQIKEKILVEENYIWTDNKEFLNQLHNIFPRSNGSRIDPPVIRELLNAYFKTIVQNVSDQVPKIIMYYFVNNTEKDIYIKLFNNLSLQDISEILSESPEIAIKRNELNISVKKIITAIDMIKSY